MTSTTGHGYGAGYGDEPADRGGDAADGATHVEPDRYGVADGGATGGSAWADPATRALPSYGTATPPPPSDEPSPWPGAAAPPAAPPARRGPSRGVALLLAGVLGGAAAGAGTALAVTHDRTTTVATAPSAGLSQSGGTVTDGGSSTVAGTPESAAAVIAPSVVTIAVTGQQQSTSPFGGSSAVSDTGSGIVLRSDGYVLTNNHVIAAAINGGTVSVTTSDGKTYPASIAGADPTDDLAVVRVQGASGLQAATFADSGKLVVGQAVLAVGAPLGLSNTVTQGIVSTLHRPVRAGESASEQAVYDAVQTDAAINPGNSGGALVDLAGRVVGVNSAIAGTGDTTGGGQSGNIGVGFAIPSNEATKVAQQLISSGKATHPQVGVSVTDATASGAQGTPGAGALVRAVTSGGPAAAAGLQAGDVITKVDDRTVTDADSLIVAVRAHDPGQSVTLTWTRNGQTQTGKAVLATASGS